MSVRLGLAILLLTWPLRAAETPAPAPVRLEVRPATISLDGAVDRHRLLVTAVTADGRATDVTERATYRSSTPGVVTVSAAGECAPAGNGTAEIIVEYGGRAATVPVRVLNAALARAPSFLNDVTPVLTRLGCNQGACHGKGAGQNGFRLSLRGYAPEMDHVSITREFDGRRLNPSVPTESLLLLKPLGAAPHDGGKLFQKGSRSYDVLLHWIEAGVPGPAATDPTVRRLEIVPGSRTYRPGETQRLLVLAEYSDGAVKDVTWLTKFDSNDAGVAAVDPSGLVTAQRPGETSVRGMFQGQVAVVGVTVPFDRPVNPEALAAKNNFIDTHVFAKLGALNIEPSPLCSDEAFIRRAFLDAIGVLPTPGETRAFLADTDPRKRDALVDRLLARPEFADFWAVELGDLFQNRKERDHDVRGVKGVRSFHHWLRGQVAANTPWDQIARSVLTAKGPTSETPAVGYFVVTVGEHGEPHRSEVVASVAQAFLGTRIGCAQCHNHPLEKYTQDDYYHFAAFFSRIRMLRKDPKDGPTALLVSAPDPNQNGTPVGVHQPRTGRFITARPLDRSPLDVTPGEDPREKLARWMTDPANEYFSGAMVNRLWKHYLGVGLVEPVDDLRASNPPTNPALWNALLKEFVGRRFDLKHVMRLILTSRTYQLSSSTTEGNSSDTRFYSHYYARRLPAEVLLDALSQSTGLPDSFPGYPTGVRAVQIPDPSLKSYFLSLFGRSERVTACACERNGEVTMPQLLHLLNGDTIVNKVRSGDGRLANLLRAGKPTSELVEELYLTTYSRRPTPREASLIQQNLGPDANRDEFLQDLFWALLNSKEFSFNH